MVDIGKLMYTRVQENVGIPGVLLDMKPVPGNELIENNVEVITLRKTEEGFGFNIVGGTDSQHFPGEDGIFISRLKQGGPAESSKKLVPGDEILSVNNINIQGKTHDEAVRLFSDCDESARLIVDHGSEAKILREGEIHGVMESLTGMRAGSFNGGKLQPISINEPNSNELMTSNPVVLAEIIDSLPRRKENLRFAEEYVLGMDCDFKPVQPPKSYLHTSASFGSQKAEGDSTNFSRARFERDDDEMSTITNASTHYYVDDVPQTPRRDTSILDGDSPYAGFIYGCVGVGVLIVAGAFIINRIIRRNRSH